MPGPPAQLQRQGERVYFMQDMLFPEGSLWTLQSIVRIEPQIGGADATVILTFQLGQPPGTTVQLLCEAIEQRLVPPTRQPGPTGGR